MFIAIGTNGLLALRPSATLRGLNPFGRCVKYVITVKTVQAISHDDSCHRAEATVRMRSLVQVRVTLLLIPLNGFDIQSVYFENVLT